jgi:hypothetical protein
VIYVSAQRFAKEFQSGATGGQVLIIHELLHSLGLGAQITDRVRDRCGSAR